MAELAASLLSADFSCLETQFKILIQSDVKWLHIDVMDGNFVPSLSFGFPVIQTIRKSFPGVFDVHLMIQEPIRYIERFAQAGSDRITVHCEACSDVEQTLKKIRACGCRAGVAISPKTPVESVYPYLELTDLILVMTVEPGFGGQKYLHSVTQKVKTLRSYLDQKGRDVLIEVDGGINIETAPEAVAAGSDILVSGSSVFCGDIEENVKRLKDCIHG